MFKNCKNLPSLTLTNFETSQVKYMQEMFYSCNLLSSLDLSKFITTQVTNMTQMFYDTTNLVEIDMSNFDTTNCAHYDKILDGCNEKLVVTINKNKCSNIISEFPSYITYKE